MSQEKSAAEQEQGIREYLQNLTGEEPAKEPQAQAQQPEAEQKPEPEKQPDPVAAPEPTAEVKTETPKANEAPTEEEEWWKKGSAVEKEPEPDDLKAEIEKYKSQLSKYEQNKFVKQLAELVDAPDFDFEKFLEAQISKRVDYAAQPLENLFKASLEADTVAGYTDEDIESLWEEKKAELEGKPALEKKLKSELVKEFQSKEPQQTEESPEIKSWKEQKAAVQKQNEVARAEHERVTKGIEQFTKGLVGKTVAGYKVAEEDIAETAKRMDINFYKKPDGKIDEVKLGLDRLKAALFDKVIAHKEATAKKEAVKSITRASTDHAGNSLVDTDGRTQQEKVLDEYAQSRGYKNHKDLIDNKK